MPAHRRQVRLRQISWSGRPKHGVSVSVTSRRQWLCTRARAPGSPLALRRLDHHPDAAAALTDFDHLEAVEPYEQITAIAQTGTGHECVRARLGLDHGEVVTASRSHPTACRKG
jgi:hypothetical protein